jgi:predicted amidohydrolase YtcJ
VGPDLEPFRGDEIVEGGVTVIPGLHDHHLHLTALAAHLASVDLGPDRVATSDDLARVLTGATAAAAGGWVRAVGYEEATGGRLDRTVLDRLVPDRPVRVQDRTGHLWVLNSIACRRVGLDGTDGAPAGAERVEGVATGRLVDADGWLATRLPSAGPPDLAAADRRLAAYGVTGVTDATPGDRWSDLEVLADAVASGALRQRVFATGGVALAGATAPVGIQLGPVKVMVGDASYPSVEELATVMATAHRYGRGVALHCASRIAAVLAVAAWEEAGAQPGDRMEHGSVLPPDLVVRLAALGVTVVTQPAFVYDRGDRYLAAVEPADLPHLYRCASLETAGVGVGGSTDAPFGPDDPWLAMRSAVSRRTRSGATVGPEEGVTPARALGLFLSEATTPGGPPRSVAVGAPADLVVLDCPLAGLLEDLDAGHVVATVVAGRLVHKR